MSLFALTADRNGQNSGSQSGLYRPLGMVRLPIGVLTDKRAAGSAGGAPSWRVFRLFAIEVNFFFIWFVRLLALRPLLAYCASLG
jgi:hypothetical protein